MNPFKHFQPATGAEFQTQLPQSVRVPVNKSKLKANTLVVSRPVKFFWERHRPCTIRAILEGNNSSAELGSSLEPAEEKVMGGFPSHNKSFVPPGAFGSDSYKCGPLTFKWRHSMLMMEPNFDMPIYFQEAKTLVIAFQS